MITEDYVSFEIAKLLKEKGFNQITNMAYMEGHLTQVSHFEVEHNPDRFDCYVYTQQMAMKWLREVHNIIITMDYDEYELEKIGNKHVGYGWNIQKTENPTVYLKISEHVFDTYEESCEDAIKYCLENLI